MYCFITKAHFKVFNFKVFNNACKVTFQYVSVINSYILLSLMLSLFAEFPETS